MRYSIYLNRWTSFSIETNDSFPCENLLWTPKQLDIDHCLEWCQQVRAPSHRPGCVVGALLQHAAVVLLRTDRAALSAILRSAIGMLPCEGFVCAQVEQRRGSIFCHGHARHAQRALIETPPINAFCSS